MLLSSRQILSSLFISLFLISIGFADSRPEPQQILEDTSKEMIQIFIEKTDAIRKDPQIAHTIINEHIITKINFKLMSRWVLGSNWKKATAEQQQEFMIVFKQMVTKFYSKALIQYLSSNDLTVDIITFKPYRRKIKGKYVTIRSLIHPPSGAEPINVNYDMYHNKAGQWQVYDVAIEGISLVTSYRSSFKKIVKEEGMESLISQLKEKTSQLKDSDVASNES